MMFIAVLAILSCQVPGARSEDQALWAYVPDPPVLRSVTWNDPSFPVYLSDTSVLGFPSSSHITLQVAKYDFTAQAAGPPIHLPHPSSVHTVSNLDGEELFTYEGNNDLRPGKETYVNRDWGLVYNGIKVSPDFPKIKRERCTPSNQSLDPSPPWRLCYPKQKQPLSYTLSTGFTLFDWSVPFPLGTGLYEVPGEWSTPIFTTPSGHVHSSLWKLFTAIIPSFVHARFRSTSYPAKQTVYVQACVASPYALLYGDIKIAENNGHYSITCSACTLANCLDSTVFPTPVILIVHQPPYVMLPVSISGAWYDDRGLQVLQEMRDLMIRPKRFIGMLIASIIAIVTVLASAATAAVSLAYNVQTATYVNHLAKNISASMGTQMDGDKKLEVKPNALEETVNLLGDKVYNIQNHLSLRCHAEYKYICVTNAPYNESVWQWPLVKAHLQGIWSHNNLSLDILKLQKQIYAVDITRDQLPQDDTVAKDIVNTLSSWLHWTQLPPLSSIIDIGVFILLLILFLLFLFCLVFSLQQLQLKIFELQLKNKKGGTVGNAPV
ncbi:envelope glycoprotein [Plecturocebus cupreus]